MTNSRLEINEQKINTSFILTQPIRKLFCEVATIEASSNYATSL